MISVRVLFLPTALVGAALLAGCPNEGSGSSDASSNATSPTTPGGSPAAPLSAAAKGLPGATAASADPTKIVPLVAGIELPADTIDGEGAGLELLFEIRFTGTAPALAEHGAVASAVTAAQAARVGTLRVVLGAGRMRARFGAHTFALDEGMELRAERHRGGAIVVTGPSTYRVLPVGAVRPLLAERRFDVIPLAPTQVVDSASGTHHGRTTYRTRLATTFGTLVVDQIAAPASKGVPVAKGDARVETGAELDRALEGSGEPLCRLLLELVASDRALVGLPCAEGLIPVRVEVSYASGGGIVIESTSLREGTITHGDLAFPPSGARLGAMALADPKVAASAWLSNDLLLSLRAKGEPSNLEGSNKSPSLRIMFVDGIAIGLFTAGLERTVPLRAGRYVVEWRTPIGELVERALTAEVPGRVTAAQWVPSPLSSASPIASVRNGP